MRTDWAECPGWRWWDGRSHLCYHHNSTGSRVRHHQPHPGLSLILLSRPDSDLDKAEAVDAVSDVSSNELSGPEDGECESDREFGEEDKPKVTRSRPALLPLPRSPEPGVPTLTTVTPLPPLSDKAQSNDTPSESSKPTIKPDTFDPPSDLEDISPERESPTEDPADPFADFVPEEVKPEEAKEAEFESFSPDPPKFEV